MKPSLIVPRVAVALAATWLVTGCTEEPTNLDSASPPIAPPALTVIPGYEVVNLFGGFATVAGISNSGQVGGSFLTGSGDFRAFFWENGVMSNLGTLPGGDDSRATDMSRTGVVVGTSRVSGNHLPFWRAPGGMMEPIPLPLGYESAVPTLVVSDNGAYVAGVANAPPLVDRPQTLFRWDGSTLAETVHPAGAGFSVVGVNNSGVVAGRTNGLFVWDGTTLTVDNVAFPGVASVDGIDDLGRVAFQSGGQAKIWDDGTITDLVSGQLAKAMNARGDVVGFNGSTSQAFLWSAGSYSSPIDLGNLGGALTPNPQGLSDGLPGEMPYVVGNHADEAFIWPAGSPGGPMFELPMPPGAVRSIALFVNDNGWAVGDDDDGSIFLWRPVGATPQEEIDFLQAAVATTSLPADNMLLAALASAEAALAAGDVEDACRKLRIFILMVQGLVRGGQLDPTVGAEWIARAENAIDQLCP